jgi:hypothetical protein
MDPNIPTKGFFTNVRYMFDLRDVVVDVQGERERMLCSCLSCHVLNSVQLGWPIPSKIVTRPTCM